MAVQQIDRLTGASRHACWRCQFNTPDCAQPHDDGLRAICHALWLQDNPARELLLQPEVAHMHPLCLPGPPFSLWDGNDSSIREEGDLSWQGCARAR